MAEERLEKIIFDLPTKIDSRFAAASGDSQITISWDTVPGAATYNIYEIPAGQNPCLGSVYLVAPMWEITTTQLSQLKVCQCYKRKNALFECK